MAVFKRKTSNGESKYYHYKFMIKGKTYTGVCKGCTKKRDAEQYEKDLQLKANELSKQKSLRALVENFRDEMAGGNSILLSEAFELSLKKPRKKQFSQKQHESKRSYWLDFLAFLNNEHPQITKLSDVIKKHAEEYIQYLRTEGRYDKKIEYGSGDAKKSYVRKHNLSNRTCNVFQNTLREVFDLLAEDAGLIDNPFKHIPKLNNEYQSREAFSEEELRLISQKADSFIRSIFSIGITTALREGDICTLRWSEIDFDRNLITRKMLKTGNVVEIPILPPLRSFLLDLKEKHKESEFVLPMHAEMYLNNPDGICWRVKKFLNSIGIKTTKKIPGRTRQISVKDVHSLRHTFCYMAGVYGIPFLVVKDICGHVSEEMTSLYQKHANVTMKREKLQQMPDFMGLIPENSGTINKEQELRESLIQLVNRVRLYYNVH